MFSDARKAVESDLLISLPGSFGKRRSRAAHPTTWSLCFLGKPTHEPTAASLALAGEPLATDQGSLPPRFPLIDHALRGLGKVGVIFPIGLQFGDGLG